MQKYVSPNYLIYKITNLINGKMYIGCTTKTPYERFLWHKHMAKRGSRRHLHKAIRKYGLDNFKQEVICTCLNHKEMLEKEKEFIRLYKTHDRNIGYNLTLGGEGTIGFKFSEEQKKRMSLYWLGKKRGAPSLETRKKISLGQIGKKRPPEVGQKLRALFLGRRHPPEIREKIKKAINGAKWRYIPIYQYSLKGVLIREWNYICGASRFYKLCPSAITNALNGRAKTSGGFIWRYKKLSA